MSENRETFIFYRSFYDAISDLKDKDRLKLYDAICKLYFEGEEIELVGIQKTLFTLMKPLILANQEKMANGKKGGRPKKETIGFQKTKPEVFENIKPMVIADEKPVGVFEKKPKEEGIKIKDKGIKNKDKRLQEERKKEEEKILNFYTENIGFINPAVATVLCDYLDNLEVDMIIEAIRIATLSNKKNARYIQGILNNWINKGYKVLSDIQEEKQNKTNDELEKWMNE